MWYLECVCLGFHLHPNPPPQGGGDNRKALATPPSRLDSRRRSPLRLKSHWPTFSARLAWRGDIAQLGERGVRNAEVGGSIPPVSTNTPDPLSLAPVAQRIERQRPKLRVGGFESLQGYHLLSFNRVRSETTSNHRMVSCGSSALPFHPHPGPPPSRGRGILRQLFSP